MRILVTGATGYIGSVLIPVLKDAGHEIFPFTGAIEVAQNWSSLPVVNAVVHLAALNDLYKCENEPLYSFYVNYWGTMLSLKFCIEERARLVFTSTNTVAGLDGTPISVYDGHKWAAEKSIMSIPYKEFGGSVVLRFSTIYGYSPTTSKQSNRGIVNRWVNMALRGETLKVYESVADKKRDYLHVDDVVSAIVKSLDAKPGSYHICTGRSIPIGEMAALINVIAGGKGGVAYTPAPPNLHPIEYRNESGSPHLFHWHTGWQAQTEVVMGVDQTIKQFKEQMQRENGNGQ